MTRRVITHGNTALGLAERRLLNWAGAVLLSLGTAAPATAQFSVQPVIVELPAADSSVTTVIEVVNQGKSDLLFRFYAADFEQDETGDHQFMDAGKHARSCAARLSISPDGATVAAQQRQTVVVRLAPGADSTCWSLVFFEGRDPAAAGIHVNQRIGVKVYGLARTIAREAEVTSVRVERQADSLAVTVEVRNGGSVPVRPFGRVELRDMSGEVVQSVNVEAFSVLPGHLRRAVVMVRPDIAKKGTYLAVPILDFGNDYLIGGQASFEIQ